MAVVIENPFRIALLFESHLPSNAPGTFAEYIVIDSDVVIKKPANIDFAAASIPLVGLTTVQCFDKARLKAGDKVLIHAGSGGVGKLIKCSHFPMPSKPYFTKKAAGPKGKLSLG